MDHNKRFQVYYQKNLLPSLVKLQARKKKEMGRLLVILLAGIGGAIVIGNLIALFAPGFSWLLGLLLFAGSIGYVVWKTITLVKEIRTEYKHLIVQKIVHYVKPELTYEAFSFISKEEFLTSKIFLNKIDRYKGDDLVWGTIGETDMKFSEVQAQQYQKNNNGGQYHDIFKGIFFIADFHKDFEGETFVLPDVAESWFGRIGKWFQKMNFTRPELVKMEDPVFEKQFVVYSNCQVEARYILTPDMMKRIVSLKANNGKISLSFINSKVYIALGIEKDLFEPSFFDSLVDFKNIREFYWQLLKVISIVEGLNLNTRIWTKE